MSEQTMKILKAVLVALLIILLATLVFTLTAKKNTVVNQTPADNNATPTSEQAVEVPPVFQEAAKSAASIQDQVKAGNLSAEEAKKQLDVVGANIPVPPLPPEMKK